MPIDPLTFPPPTLFGLPARYTQWRSGQFEAIQASMASQKRFVVNDKPTGFGKSVDNIAEAVMSGVRTLVLTSTKALQNQYLDDFKSLGMLDIRGQSNYSCLASYPGGEFDGFAEPYTTVDEAPCKWGLGCSLMVGGCTYYDKKRAVYHNQLVVTNYDLHLSMNRFSEGLGEFGLIICDEAHEAPAKVANNMAAEVSDWDIKHTIKSSPPDNDKPRDWAIWASRAKALVGNKIDNLVVGSKDHVGSHDKLRQLFNAKRTLEQMACAEADWIIQHENGHHRVEPVWPRKFAEPFLFTGAKKVVFSSATIRPKTPHLLGLTELDYDYFEYPSPFPVANRPIYYVPVAAMRFGMAEEEEDKILRAVDQIINRRLDRKIMVHSVSYKLQKLIMERSQFTRIMLGNTKSNTDEVMEEFRRRTVPCVLVTPSADTGVDLPGIECETVVVVKVPFPDISSPIYKARIAEDKEYGVSEAISTLEQMSGRHVRSFVDRGETIILDKMFGNLLSKYPHLFHKWYLQAVRHRDYLPNPLQKL